MTGLQREPRPRRLILLGASNLTRGLSAVVASAVATFGPGIDIRCAIGHGRSYGAWSRVLVRSLPGIVDCGLWRGLEPAAANVAVITDVGNDIMYGYAPEQIEGWVRTCVERLLRLGAATVLVLPPVRRLATLRPWQYHVARALLFPGDGPSFAGAMRRVDDLDHRLRTLAAECGLTTVEPEPEWYGIDPIHVRRRCFGAVWKRIFARLAGREPPPSAHHPSLLRWLTLHSARAEHWRLLGIELGSPQPSRRLADGTCVSHY